MKARRHGKRSAVAKIAKVRAVVKRRMGQSINREANMELAHALLALGHARRFIMNAERLTAKTL